MNRATAEPFIRLCSALTFRGDNGDDEPSSICGCGQSGSDDGREDLMSGEIRQDDQVR